MNIENTRDQLDWPRVVCSNKIRVKGTLHKGLPGTKGTTNDHDDCIPRSKPFLHTKIHETHLPHLPPSPEFLNYLYNATLFQFCKGSQRSLLIVPSRPPYPPL